MRQQPLKEPLKTQSCVIMMCQYQPLNWDTAGAKQTPVVQGQVNQAHLGHTDPPDAQSSLLPHRLTSYLCNNNKKVRIISFCRSFYTCDTSALSVPTQQTYRRLHKAVTPFEPQVSFPAFSGYTHLCHFLSALDDIGV